MTVESPCIRHCTLDDRDVCVGCGRTLGEITGWTRLTDPGKREVLDRSRARLAERQR